MKKVQIHLIYLLFIFPFTTFGFVLNVSSSSETCTGNGSLTFTATDIDANGTILYTIYKLPDLVVPISITSNTNLNGLTSGLYRIIAKETVNGVVTTQQVDVTISSNIVPLVFSISSLNQACTATSSITVNTITGFPVSFEIFDGPILYPLQSSNVFSGLIVGDYRIRVFDACGNGSVQAFTVIQNQAQLSIADPIFTNTNPTNCNFTIVNNTITPASGTIIGYPLSVVYNVQPPTGTVISFTQNITNGNLTSQTLSQTIPYYLNQDYSYSITITDVCGTIISKNFLINQGIELLSTIVVLDCNEYYFTLTASNFTPPYSLNFLNVPVGFNPSAFNANYPGPYTENTIDFGSPTNPTPIGQYTVQITDSCGRTLSTARTFSVVSVPILPTSVATNEGCLANQGKIEISILGSNLVTVIITNAPASYPFPLPHNVSNLIDVNGNFTLSQIPSGNYTFSLLDSCSSVLLPLDIVVPVYQDKGITTEIREGCSLQKGSIKINSNNGALTSVILTSAPSTFSTSLPLNLSNNIITNGVFYLGNLPPGNYTFATIDGCNFTSTKTITIAGYTITSQSFSLQPNCGSFTIPLNFVSNGTANQKFWLQKLINASSNTWGNPATNVVYNEGSVPTATNSLLLVNNANNLNLSFNGTFRIVRYFSAYYSGSEVNNGTITDINSRCIEILAPTLSFNQSLDILDANRLPCSSSGNLDVFINAVGTNPLKYKIVSKNGNPFFLDNGNSNVFYGLPQGLYQFVVEDACGNITNKIYDIATLSSFIVTTQPENMLQCTATITGNETFNLTLQNPIILGSQAASEYTISYYNSLADAQNAQNSIVNTTTFNPTTNSQELYARIIFNVLPSCYEVLSFKIIVGLEPKLNVNQQYINCSTAPQIIDASIGNLPTTTYLWSDGSTNPIISISQIGITNQIVIATNSYESNLKCTKSINIKVINSQIPQFDTIETVDWTTNENSITVITTQVGNFLYSLDGINFQETNVFSNLLSGLYTVYVKDIGGCVLIEQQVWLLNYPRYFTPNDDGFHDYWFIKNSNFEPNFKVTIFDRYGKLITNFNSTSQGWDGNYNGNKLISDDYWFVINRQDGRIHKGHFAMKR